MRTQCWFYDSIGSTLCIPFYFIKLSYTIVLLQYLIRKCYFKIYSSVNLVRPSMYRAVSLSPKEGVKMEARWSYQWNTEHIHGCFKCGRLAGSVMVLKIHLCFQAISRVQQAIQLGGSHGHTVELHSHWAPLGTSHLTLGLLVQSVAN